MSFVVEPIVDGESSKPHKDDELESQSNEIPDKVLSNTLFP